MTKSVQAEDDARADLHFELDLGQLDGFAARGAVGAVAASRPDFS